jgi:HD-like signal output (HDOD) protein
MQVEDVVDDWVVSPPYLYFRLKEVIENPDSSFKDIGDMILHEPALYARILKISNSSLFNPESEVKTIEHAWKLPERLLEVSACHHDPIQAKNYSRDVSIIHLAYVILHEIDLQRTGAGFSPPIYETIVQSVGLTSRNVSAIKKELKEQFGQTAEVFLSSS